MEPVPARALRRCRADQPAVRAAGGDHRAQRGAGARGAELRRPRHRQHGGAGRVRLTGAAGPLAQAAAGRRDQVRVLHDRAGRRLLRRRQHRHPDPARRGLVRDQRHQVVVLGGDGPGLRDPHRDGQDRPGRRTAPAAVDDPGAQGHSRDQHPPRHATVRLRRRPARRPRRGRLLRRPGARRQPHKRGGRRVRHRPGPARPGPDPPLHAADRRRRAGAGTAVYAGHPSEPRSAGRSPSRA